MISLPSSIMHYRPAKGKKCPAIDGIGELDPGVSVNDFSHLQVDLAATYQPPFPRISQPFFAGPRPPLRLVASDLIGEDAIRLTYVPA